MGWKYFERFFIIFNFVSSFLYLVDERNKKPEEQ